VRPLRLAIEGFTAFREPTALDLTGVELFAVTGATGAGKTSIIDALCFALYGCVPRYDDKRLVAPAISQGRNEARVRLDFAVGGATYSAVRVVRRTRGGGATTREATLERTTDGDGAEVMARNERELGDAVESLLGLRYEHFVKCVVLPQGDFARFLHDKAEKRQELLVELLDLGVYERMGRLARERDKGATLSAQALARRLDELAPATALALADATRRAAALTGLRERVDAAAPRLAELEGQAAEASRRASEARDRVRVLEGIEVPAGTAELGRVVARAVEEVQRRRQHETDAEVRTTAAVTAVDALPPRAELEVARRAHADAAEQRDLLDRGQRARADRRGDEVAAATAVAAAQMRMESARAALDRGLAEHRAHAVAADLVAGAPCQVCRQEVMALPDVVVPATLDQARAEHELAQSAVELAVSALSEAVRERERVELRLESVTERLRHLEALLVKYPDRAALERVLDALGEADEALERARTAEAEARRHHEQARTRLDEVRTHEADARSGYDGARDLVAGLAPPAGRAGDLAADWSALAAWAAGEAVVRRRVVDDQSRRARALARSRSELDAELDVEAAELGVAASARPLRDAVVEAHLRAEQEAEALAEKLAEADRLRGQRARLDQAAAVARELGRHLSARGFEKWLLDEALGLLVEGATVVLRDLSRGQYSLTLDERTSNFAVIDHRNADERRPARTLSGGETFLASLALALALADQLALLAARGAARLESIFLDEGFGTLDPDTLDTVAAAIEELGSRDRMVGLISHVPELAERVPVRFEVTKHNSSASIRRIDQ